MSDIISFFCSVANIKTELLWHVFYLFLADADLVTPCFTWFLYIKHMHNLSLFVFVTPMMALVTLNNSLTCFLINIKNALSLEKFDISSPIISMKWKIQSTPTLFKLIICRYIDTNVKITLCKSLFQCSRRWFSKSFGRRPSTIWTRCSALSTTSSRRATIYASA